MSTLRLHLRHRAAPLAAVLLAVLVAGCGTSFKLPTETLKGVVIPGQGTYQRIDTWTGMDNAKDILLTPSGELFVVFQDDLNHTGMVHRYPQSKAQSAPHPPPLSATFPGLTNPTAICFGANRLFVLDQGDTAAARTQLPGNTKFLYYDEANADVDTLTTPLEGMLRPIANVSSYWYVHEYLLDGTPVSTFTDTSFASVSGIAADASGRVYVAGTIMYCHVDPFSSQVRTLEFRYRVRRYLRGAPDPEHRSYVLGGSWHKDLAYHVLEGTGFGSTRDPQGMQWADPPYGNAGPVGPALYFADKANNQVQKYADPTGYANSFKLDIGGSGADSMLLSAPVDVAVDSAGYVYMVDAGNLRVLRYNPDGVFVQRVDRNPDDVTPPLIAPSAVAADNRQVYVVDRGNGQVLRFRRRD